MPYLQFKGKTAVETYHHTVPHHILDFDPKLSVLGKGQNPSLDGNLIIEGDNLLALKALLPTHAGKVKCIYIDPPYNTGNEGWVYNDNLTQPQFKEWLGKEVGKEGGGGERAVLQSRQGPTWQLEAKRTRRQELLQQRHLSN
jgi:adenine-specific DNA-methyltransferase